MRVFRLNIGENWNVFFFYLSFVVVLIGVIFRFFLVRFGGISGSYVVWNFVIKFL